MRGGNGIAGTAHGLKSWNALVDRRKRGKRAVRLGLVPVGDGIIIVRAVVGMTMLNGGAQ